MNDLISREEAAKRLEDLAEKWKGSYSGEAFEFAAKVVRGVPTAVRWIPVTERLPEDEELVLILCKNGAIYRRKKCMECGCRFRTLEIILDHNNKAKDKEDFLAYINRLREKEAILDSLLTYAGDIQTQMKNNGGK